MSDLPRIANVRFLATNGRVTLTDGNTYLRVRPEDAARLLAELLEAVGMRCETCQHWLRWATEDIAGCAGACALIQEPNTATRADFYCSNWRATL